jgi:hypothetical protein
MIRQSQRMLTAVVVAGLAAAPGAVFAQDAPRKLVAPVRGEATIDMTAPNTRVVEIITTFVVKNTSPAPIAGFRVEENWYDKANNAIGGDSYRHPKPLPPNEVIKIELKTPRNPQMQRNQYQFSHANGAIKPKTVKSIDVPKPGQ